MLKNRYFRMLAVSLISISFYMFLLNIKFFYAVMFKIISVVSPVLTGLVLAFLNNILLVKFEKRLKNRKLSLALSVMTIFLFIAAFVFLILPELKNAIFTLMENFPSYMIRVNRFADKLNSRFGFSFPKIPDNISLSSINPNGILNTVSGVVSCCANVIIGFIISVYILIDKENFARIFKNIIKKLFKNHYMAIFKFASVSDIIFTNYIIGQLIEALILGILTFLGMLIFRLPYGVMISGVVSVTSLVPVFGTIAGSAIGFLLILAENPAKAVWFVVFMIILQQIEGNLIYPKVMGKSVGLPSVAVIIAVTLGFGIAGVAGTILSVPAASVIYYYIWDSRQKNVLN